MPPQLLLASNFALPAKAVTESLAVLGRKGGGKTNTGGVLFEQMFGIGAQSVALDPVGNWWGLRLSANGKRKGLDIPVFGGSRGDKPITATSGRLLAQIIVERKVSCVIDVSFFKPEHRRQFGADFAEELFELKKTRRSPLHLFVEEARLFAPQVPKSKLDQRMTDAFESIVRLGRNYGIGVSLLDQRPQSVNKEVLSQTEILIVHQLTETHGRKAIEDWVRGKTTKGAEQLGELDQLKVGEAFVWSPGLLRTFARVLVQKKSTYDASRTPELGDELDGVAPRPLDAGDLDRLEDAMKEVADEVAANDPGHLRQEVTRLRAKVAELQDRPLPKAVKEVLIPAIDPKIVTRLEALANQVRAGLAPLLDKVDQIDLGLRDIRLAATKAGGVARVAAATATSSRRTSTPRPPAVAGLASLEGPQRRILEALAWLSSIGIQEADVTTTAFLAGYKVGGAFNNPKGRLRSEGYIDYPSPGTLRLTAKGVAASPAIEEPLTTQELHDHVMARLTGPEKRLLAPLLQAYPNSMTAVELAAAAGYEIGGAFNNPKGRLRSLGLAEYPTAGTVRATDRLFLKEQR